MTIEEFSPLSFQMSELWTTPRRRAFSFLLSFKEFDSTWWPIRDCGHRPLRESHAQAATEDEYILIDDPKNALHGVDCFLGPASLKAKRIECDAKFLHCR